MTPAVLGEASGSAQAVRRASAWAWALLAYAFALRLICGARIDLLPEEAYYWNYARHLDIGYLDHPPMVAWLIHLGTAAFGDTEFAVRAGAAACAALTSFFVFRLTRVLFGSSSAWFALAAAQVLPFFFVTGMLMTPDAPLTAAWAAAAYFLVRALVLGEARAWGWAGVAMGLGLLSKYTIAMLGPVALIFMLVDRDARGWFRRPQPYLATLLALAIFSPVILWNARHDWASFAFQTAHRLAEAPRFTLHRLIASALVLLTPTGVIALALMLARPGREAAARLAAAHAVRGRRLLRVAVLLPLAVFAAFSLRHEVKLDWTGAPWSAALPLLGLGLAQAGSAPRFGFWLGKAWLPTVLVVMPLYGVGLYHLAIGLPGVGYGRQAELVPVGWRQLGRDVHAAADAYGRAHGAEPLIVGMDRYGMASELAFYAPDPVRSVANTSSAHLFGGMGLMYERWFPLVRLQGRDALLVAWDPRTLEAPAVAPRVAPRAAVASGEWRRGGVPVATYYYRFAAGYRPP